MHGGSVEARSDGPGQGSEFIVRLPLQAETTAAEVGDKSEANTPSDSLHA
jgi:hypothetical protein